MRRMAELQKIREKKAAKRRFIRKVKTRMLTQFGSFVGERMYSTWRRSVSK